MRSWLRRSPLAPRFISSSPLCWCCRRGSCKLFSNTHFTQSNPIWVDHIGKNHVNDEHLPCHDVSCRCEFDLCFYLTSPILHLQISMIQWSPGDRKPRNFMMFPPASAYLPVARNFSYLEPKKAIIETHSTALDASHLLRQPQDLNNKLSATLDWGAYLNSSSKFKSLSSSTREISLSSKAVSVGANTCRYSDIKTYFRQRQSCRCRLVSQQTGAQPWSKMFRRMSSGVELTCNLRRQVHARFWIWLSDLDNFIGLVVREGAWGRPLGQISGQVEWLSLGDRHGAPWNQESDRGIALLHCPLPLGSKDSPHPSMTRK